MVASVCPHLSRGLVVPVGRGPKASKGLAVAGLASSSRFPAQVVVPVRCYHSTITIGFWLGECAGDTNHSSWRAAAAPLAVSLTAAQHEAEVFWPGEECRVAVVQLPGQQACSGPRERVECDSVARSH
jgi:hypothetical protein